MAVLSSVSPSALIAVGAIAPKPRMTALGAGTKSGSTSRSRTTASHTPRSVSTLTACSARTRTVALTPSTGGGGRRPRPPPRRPRGGEDGGGGGGGGGGEVGGGGSVNKKKKNKKI